MKPLRSLAALAIAGLVCAGGIAAVAAPASATAGVSASASSVAEPLHANALSSATDCPWQKPYYFTTYYDGCVHWTKYACVALHHFNISPPNYVSNSCPQAVDLFSRSGETGSIICIPGNGRSGYLHNPWRSFRITGGGTCLHYQGVRQGVSDQRYNGPWSVYSKCNRTSTCFYETRSRMVPRNAESAS
jgi:hypothetical protein